MAAAAALAGTVGERQLPTGKGAHNRAWALARSNHEVRLDFEQLVSLLEARWATIAAVAVLVGPLSWAITRWLYENRVEEVAAENRRLKTSGPTSPIESSAQRTGGVGQGQWLDMRQTDGDTYSYRLSLTQQGARITGSGTITRSGRDSYDQPFDVEGKEFAGCILLTLTSASAGSTSAIAGLFRVVDRGTRLSGQWSYRARISDEIVAEAVSLSRQPGA